VRSRPRRRRVGPRPPRPSLPDPRHGQVAGRIDPVSRRRARPPRAPAGRPRGTVRGGREVVAVGRDRLDRRREFGAGPVEGRSTVSAGRYGVRSS
jgi:hypothetical protein